MGTAPSPVEFADPFAEFRRDSSERGRRHGRDGRRRLLRLLGTTMIVAGLCSIGWAVVVWRWQDPFTALYTMWQQRQLASSYEKRLDMLAPRLASVAAAAAQAQASAQPQARPEPARLLAAVAEQYRLSSKRGDALGRLKIPGLGLSVIVVEGTDGATLKKGPGRDPHTYMPGEGALVYVAGHRTTYGAPFANIDKLHRGDRITLELPYATYVYAVTGRRIVRADHIQALDSRGREEIALQACWPRFFASHRIIVYGRPVQVTSRPAVLRGLPSARARPARASIATPSRP